MKRHIDMGKKSYINPEVLVVTLRPCSMLLEPSSIEIVSDPDDPFDPEEEGTVFSRENETSSQNTVWDNIW